VREAAGRGGGEGYEYGWRIRPSLSDDGLDCPGEGGHQILQDGRWKAGPLLKGRF
jgi:hypothetical protein